MLTNNASAVGVLRVIVRVPAANLPSGNEMGLTETDKDGPSLSAITRLALTIPPSSAEVSHPHEEMKTAPEIVVFRYPSTSLLSMAPILNFNSFVPLGR